MAAERPYWCSGTRNRSIYFCATKAQMLGWMAADCRSVYPWSYPSYIQWGGTCVTTIVGVTGALYRCCA